MDTRVVYNTILNRMKIIRTNGFKYNNSNNNNYSS